jgi:hypothetical protein
MSIDFVPSEFHLGQNYPNPFRDQTRITYCVPVRCRVTLTICDSAGEIIEQLVDEVKPAGAYEVIWKARDLPCGIYLSLMRSGRFRETRKMSLLR